MLRPGHTLLFDTEFETDGHLFEVWSIQFGDDKSYAWFKIRESRLRSRLKTDEERKAWEQRIDHMKKSFREFKLSGKVKPASQSELDNNASAPRAMPSGTLNLSEAIPLYDKELQHGKLRGLIRPARNNARAVVESYVESALAGDVAKAASLAKNSPADPKRIRELPEFLNVQRLKIEKVYINDPSKPTQALATSVAVKLGEEHKNPDGRRDGFIVFTLELSDDKWFVIDIDIKTESGAEKELNEFLRSNPNSIGIPPQS